MKNFLHKALVVFSLIFSGSLLLAYVAPYIDPEKFWLPAFWGLSYPYLLAFNLFFVIYWCFRRKWSFLIPLLAIAIGYSHLQSFIQLNRSTEYSSQTKSLKIVTYNVRGFDKYEWSKDPKTPKKMIALLQNSHADIYCFQEFHFTSKGLLSLANLKKSTGCKYLYVGKNHNGVAIFSKYPILNKGEISFGKGNWCNAIFADINLNQKRLRIYNLHLESNRLGGKNYAFINQKNFKADEKEFNELKDISYRLKHAFVRRSKQAKIIRSEINKSPFPCLICGDFNDTAHSYTYRIIKGELKDSFQERGFGIGTTYSGDFPSFRIDFVLHAKSLQCLKYQRIKKKYSDHFPVLTELAFTDQ